MEHELAEKKEEKDEMEGELVTVKQTIEELTQHNDSLEMELQLVREIKQKYLAECGRLKLEG